jgi:putative ABC transport system permease protein|tara:strand:- start:643 stop:1794 length:1152 start_codon:yes stop_codon:yes gene_type:complete
MKYLILLWAGLARRKVRTTLTLLSVIIAFLLFGTLRSVVDAFNIGVEIAGADRLITSGKYSIIEMFPISYLNRIESVEGVESVTHQTWFGGTYKDPSNFFPRWPVDIDRHLTVYPEYIVSPETVRSFKTNRQAAIAGRDLAEQYGWKVGDRIPIIPDIWPQARGGAWEFDLVGTFDTTLDGSPTLEFWMTYDYFDEARAFGQGSVGWFTIKVANGTEAQDVARNIDAMFANSTNETKTSTEKQFALSFAKQMGDIGLIMTGILGAVFFTIVLLTGNTMAQSIRERVPELAVLKTLGFTNGGVLALVMAESTLLTAVGGAIGLGLSTLLVTAMSDTLSTFVPGLANSTQNIGLGFTAAILLGVVVGFVPALRAMRLRIVDAMRG